MNEKFTDVEELLYPSISICKKYTFADKRTMWRLINDTGLSLMEKKEMALRDIWDRMKVFHFVTHPGMLNMTFPCITTNDGTDPGRLCSFPFAM